MFQQVRRSPIQTSNNQTKMTQNIVLPSVIPIKSTFNNIMTPHKGLSRPKRNLTTKETSKTIKIPLPITKA